MRRIAVMIAVLLSLVLVGCGESNETKEIKAVGDAWDFNGIVLGKRFNEYGGVEFVLLKEEVLDQYRTRRHYSLKGGKLRFGPIKATFIHYTFNHNNIFKDIEVGFRGRDMYEQTRTVLETLYGQAQATRGGRELEWVHNLVLFNLRYLDERNPPGMLHITLLTPCKNY